MEAGKNWLETEISGSSDSFRRNESESSKWKKSNFFELLVGGKIVWQKMWQKCGIFASNRPLWERIGNSGQKRTGTRVWAQIPGISAKKWSTILGISRNLLSTSKLRIFQIPPDGVLQQSRKILCEIHKKLHNLKMRGSASSPDDFEHRFGLDGIQKTGTNV